MNRSEEEIARLSEWRREQHLTLDKGDQQTKQDTTESTPVQSLHFYFYDPSVGLGDMSHLKAPRHNDETLDKAFFSIPVSFTRENRTVYKQHSRTEFGFDIRTVLTPHNAPIYPLRK
jgi:hypothetical protein